MSSLRMASLPALRRHHLLAEFSGLKQTCPDGVFVSLTPGDTTLWSGVIFVRKGPYATAILRFHISFPDTYPALPPLVTFSTDIFHPLITPLTTYTYTTDITDAGTVSATDEERLPPGGFSLRHGFPDWFGRSGGGGGGGGRSRQTSAGLSSSLQPPPPLPPRLGSSLGAGTSASASASTDEGESEAEGGDGQQSSGQTTPDKSFRTALSRAGSPSAIAFAQTQQAALGMQAAAAAAAARKPMPSTYDVLRYLASAFDSEQVLDAIPLEAAGNPGAWHAWRARQLGAQGMRKSSGQGGGAGSGNPVVLVDGKVEEDGEKGQTGGAGQQQQQQAARKPGEWNWEGVWEKRVKLGIAASSSEAVLFGGAAGAAGGTAGGGGGGGGGGGDEVIHFLNMDEANVQGVKENIFRTLGVAPPGRDIPEPEPLAS